MKRFEPTGHLNQTQLLEEVLAETGRKDLETGRTEARNDTAQTIRAVLDVIGRTVVAGHEVRLTNFGTFRLRPTASRRNPQTGEPTAPSRSVGFRANGLLRAHARTGEPVVSLIKRGKGEA